MSVENFTNQASTGYADPVWIRADGSFVGHPTFAVGPPSDLVYESGAGNISGSIFGAVITVAEEEPEPEMNWTDYAPDPRSVRMESPLRPYLSTLPQAITLHRPFNAEWFSGPATSIATASSSDWQGYHAGPSGTPLHHINLSHNLTPAPGGPSHDLTDALWRHSETYVGGVPIEPAVDPNITVVINDYMVSLTLDPDTGSGLGTSNTIRVKVSCEKPDGSLKFDVLNVLVGRIYVGVPHPQTYVWTIDDIFRAGDAHNIDPEGFVLRVYDDAYAQSGGVPRFMGTINPGWTAGVVRVWEYADNYSPGPKMESVTMNHTVLLDFTEAGGGIS